MCDRNEQRRNERRRNEPGVSKKRSIHGVVGAILFSERISYSRKDFWYDTESSKNARIFDAPSGYLAYEGCETDEFHEGALRVIPRGNPG